jgi:hypothetical protein
MNLSLQLINLNSKIKNSILSGTQKKPLGPWRSKSSPRSKFNSFSKNFIEDIKSISEISPVRRPYGDFANFSSIKSSQNKSFQPLGLWNLPTLEPTYSFEKNAIKKGGKK